MTLQTTFDFGFSLFRDKKISFHHFEHSTHCDLSKLQARLSQFFTVLNNRPFHSSCPRITSYSIKPINIKKCENEEDESPRDVLLKILIKVALAIPTKNVK